MVMTFVLYPLSHYYSITEPHARFLLSLLQELTINFPFHFILSLIDICKDTATRNKLIFSSAISWILRRAFVSYPKSSHFSMMCAIDTAIVRRSEAQLRTKWPRIETVNPPTSSTPSTSTPSFSAGGVTLKVVIVQFQRMNARLDTLTTELY